MRYNIAHELDIEIPDDWDVDEETRNDAVEQFKKAFASVPNGTYLIDMLLPENFHIFKYSHALHELVNYLRALISSKEGTEMVMLVCSQFKIVSDRADKVQYITLLTADMFEPSEPAEDGKSTIYAHVDDIILQVEACIQVIQKPHIVIPE